MKNIFNAIIPRHQVNINIKDLFIAIYHTLKKERDDLYNEKADDLLKKTFNRSFVYKSSSFRAIFYNVLLFLNKKGNKKIFFPETCFKPLVLCAEEINFDIYYYKLDDILEIQTDSLFKKINENSPDIIVISQHYGNYDSNAKKITKFCQDKNIIILEDQAHSFLNKETSGDITFFSFGSGKDICTFYGGACVFDKNRVPGLSGFLIDKETNEKRTKTVINILKSVPELLFSRFPFYHLFIFPIFTFLNFLWGAKKIETIFFKSDCFVSKRLYKWNSWQSILLLKYFHINQNLIKRRIIFGKLFNNMFKKYSIPNKSFLCTVFVSENIKQKWKIKKELFKKGIDTRDDYLTFFNNHNLKNRLIFIPNNYNTKKYQFYNTLKILKKITKKFD